MKLDTEFFTRRIQRALEWRESARGIDPQLCRLVWSESDGLPGVIVDRYGDHLVLQTTTLAMDQRKDVIAEALCEVINPKGIVERNDNTVRHAEGLESVKGVLRGEAPAAFDIPIDGIVYQVDILEGQKTGLYLDQLENHQRVAQLAKGKNVLDVFSHQGGFALACKKAGANQVTAIEISEGAVEAAKANGERNALEIDWITANALLPFEHPNSSFEGIQKVDRTTNKDIPVISANLHGIQTTFDESNDGISRPMADWLKRWLQLF